MFYVSRLKPIDACEHDTEKEDCGTKRHGQQEPDHSHAAMEYPLLTHEPSITRSERLAKPTRPIIFVRSLGVQFHNLRAKKGPRLDLCARLPSGRRANVVRSRWFARFLYSDVGNRQPTQTSPKYQRIRKEQAFQILSQLFAPSSRFSALIRRITWGARDRRTCFTTPNFPLQINKVSRR